MGALHEGHLSLVREARKENDVVMASIFVNPLQFSEGEDLDKYPRRLEQDCKLLSEMGVDHIFAPDSDTVYQKNHVTYVDPTGFDDSSEGTCRPGHFRGVATVVIKLFNIVQPTTAYFGQKDAAQCVLIKRIAEDLNVPVDVKIMDTVRESDGVAMSSRNAYLNEEERRVAPIVYRSLCAARELFVNTASSTSSEAWVFSTDVRQAVLRVLESEPLVKDVEYVSIDDKETMRPLTTVGASGAVVSIACRIGSVRLIDNILL